MRIISIVALMSLLSITIVAQSTTNATPSNPIAGVRMINRQPTAEGVSRHYIRVDLISSIAPSALKTELTTDNIQVQFQPSGTPVPDINGVRTQAGNDGIVIIEFGSAQPSVVPVGDSSIKVIFHSLIVMEEKIDAKGNKQSKPGKPQTDASAQGKIYDDTNIDSLKSDVLKKLSASVASAKTQNEKNVFAGLNVVFPSGGSSAQGQADLSFNKALYSGATNASSLFDELDVAVVLKKASQNTADAKHFQGGVKFRKTVLFASNSELSTIRAAVLGGSSDVPDKAVQDIANLQKRFFRALFVDDQLSFEGDVQGSAIGNVSNVVNDFSPQITTISRPVTKSGYWNFRVIPVGAELGYQVHDTDNPATVNKGIVRIKSGAELNLFYENPGAVPNKVQLTTSIVNRYLFDSESAWDTTLNKAVLTTKGDKYWAQADFKVFFLHAGPGNAGFKLTFQRGFLPPVYSFNKAFNFGLVFETNDNDTSATTKVQ